MVLLIDNYDSFTYNLYQQVSALGKTVKVVLHDEVTCLDIEKLAPEKIILSPGPKTPDESGVSLEVIKNFYKQVPMLGVCLGHQCIGQVFGSKVVAAKELKHGKTSLIYHNSTGLFQGLKKPFIAARYHSLALDKVPDDFELTAWTDDKEIIGIQHKKYPLFGIQFHPESFMTEEGDKLIKNFLLNC